MTLLPITVVCLLALLISVLAIALSWSHIRTRQLASLSWQDLISQLQTVPRNDIAALALEHLNPPEIQAGRRSIEMWDMVGGVDGLTRMKENAEVLIALAAYTQRWNPEEGNTVTARMRRDGLALRRAVVGLGLGATCGLDDSHVALYVHEAASAYYLMTRRLLALYKGSHASIYPVLAEVV